MGKCSLCNKDYEYGKPYADFCSGKCAEDYFFTVLYPRGYCHFGEWLAEQDVQFMRRLKMGFWIAMAIGIPLVTGLCIWIMLSCPKH